MASVTFYENHGYDGISKSYSGPQRRPSGLDLIDSISVGSNTWIVIYNENNYSGDYLKVSSSLDDLNHTDRMGGGDWKNQVQSFVMYGKQPSWWYDSGRPVLDLELAPNNFIFCKDDHFNGDNNIKTAPTSESDMSSHHYDTNSGEDMSGNISSLATGSNCWLSVFNNTDMTGDTMNIYPNTEHKDLKQLSRTSGGDWGDQIKSFTAYNYPPAAWDIGFDSQNFLRSWPGYVPYENDFQYQTQDATYKIDYPVVTYPDAGTMCVYVHFEYKTLAGSNDKADLWMYFDGTGQMTEAEVSWDGGSAYNIPKSVVTTVDTTAEAIGALLAPETEGGSEEVAQEFVEDFDKFVKYFNKIAGVIYNLTSSDDGRFYMVAVGVQIMNRVNYFVTTN